LGKFYEGIRQDLILYARQLGWFHSTPEKPKPTGIQSEAAKEKTLTRGEQIEANGGKPLMPNLDEAAYIVSYWQDIGVVGAGAMGPVPLANTEIAAWVELSGIQLTPWEFATIKEMSRLYLASLHDGQKPDCPPPFGDPVNEFDREQVGKKVGNAFKAFIQAARK
jgi:hypothetical protein